MDTIGEKIKNVRTQNNITQKQLGEYCGVSEQVIRSYEKGYRTPKISTLSKIANHLGMSTVELISNTTYEKYLK